MTGIYIAGRGLASALGSDVSSAIAALKRGAVRPSRVKVTSDTQWPFFAIADHARDWSERARRIVRAVADQSGAAARNGALFVATSSLDIGLHETASDFGPGLHDLGEQIASWLEWKGPVFTVYSGCASALGAILSASALMRAGETQDALILGVELRNQFTVAGFSAMQLLAPTSAQPLGAGRDGIVLGEAVAALCLSHQPTRWRVAGGANVIDGGNPAGASAAAVQAMCRTALAASGLQPSDINMIKLQAAGSPASDATEVIALRQVFEPLPALTSLKGVIGHTSGASGAAEIALLTACIEAGRLPVPNYALDASLGITLAQAVPRDLRFILANILGFGGGHAAVVLEDCAQAA